MRKGYILFILLLSILILGSCKTGNSNIGGKGEEVVVFAAASLTESLTGISRQFEEQNNGDIRIILNFAGSQSLKTSIEAGTEADVFVPANVEYMEELKNKGFVEGYRVFLRNRLVLIKNKKSRYEINDLKDLGAEGLKLATGDKSVPVGLYWEKALAAALEQGIIEQADEEAIVNNIKTREINVKDAVSKVLLNEVDAGVVYKTDVTEAISSRIEEIDIPVFEQFEAVYPIAVMKDSGDNEAVRKFVDYTLSDEGKEVFRRFKFAAD